MEGHTDFRDWEILLAPEAGEGFEPLDGAIKYDYFSLDSQNPCRKVAAFDGNTHEKEMEEARAGSDYASLVDQESVFSFHDRPRKEVGYPGMELPNNDLGGFRSDESTDGQISRLDGEKGELGDAGCLEIGEKADNNDDEKGVGLQGTGGAEGREMEHENPGDEEPGEPVKTGECYGSALEMSEKNNGSEKALTEGGEKRRLVWWKLPFELLKFCAFRVKPVWSISIAAAILGILMLRKRLYRMKPKTRRIPLKVSLDEKRASQVKINAARLNEAFSVVRRVPIIRASLPTGGSTQWTVVGVR
ncbi:unnamed protein product [Musa acuminata subsp. malaccensis]|uniref:(wild Malaysian banana) hypothetical protein n=1 Tax=Musa acuminata subsp. malaccensis TaxID=214687 RepID=A0A804JZJ9_MUSAM|nr:PREDICTED: uncharacterized protein LOC103992643 [Musa acuminata subsp. malaccensis]CAG1857690.1 unnamed protein product [Musa acuminata subsp. malaccensis]